MIKAIHHEQILQFLINYRKQTQSNFIGRVINNYKIDEGFWFRGNTKYLQSTFWTGNCFKSKIHNISFSIKEINKKLFPCIEICCRYIDDLNTQQKQVHRDFFENFATILSIKEHPKTQNYWLLTHDCRDVIEGYQKIIIEYKNKIDNSLINNPINIKNIDTATHNNFKTIIREARRRIYGLETL